MVPVNFKYVNIAVLMNCRLDGHHRHFCYNLFDGMISSGWWGIRSTKLLAARSFSAAQSSVTRDIVFLLLLLLLLCHFHTVFFPFPAANF